MPQLSAAPTIHARSSSTGSQKPRKHPNTKRTGELAEAAFVVKAAGLGYAVSKPWGDSERYDFILDAGHRTFRVQIKCTESLNANGYQVQSTYTDRKQKGHYTAADVDFLVAYILPLDLWYVVPAQAFPASASLRFYPEGNLSGRHPRFEQYREAWHLFDEGVGRTLLSDKDCGVGRTLLSDKDCVGTGALARPAEPRSAVHQAVSDCHPEHNKNRHPDQNKDCPPEQNRNCHPERSSASEAEHYGVEGPLHPPERQTVTTSPESATPASPMERMMTQWAQRVNTLYNRKR